VEFVNASTWYARIDKDKIIECREWQEGIDASLAFLSNEFKSTCKLRVEDGLSIFGHFFQCGPNNNQLLFRTRADCERYQTSINSGKEPDFMDFIPKQTKNPRLFAFALDSCYRAAATEEGIRMAGLHNISSYCGCMANKAGEILDQHLDSEKLVQSFRSCVQSSGGKVTKEFLASLESLIRSLSESDMSTKREDSGAKSSASLASKEKLKRGDQYSKVQTALENYRVSKKTPLGDYLTVEYRDKALLLYPDAGGVCELGFYKGELWRCSGCAREKFDCQNP
jgi:hypothetical protein